MVGSYISPKHHEADDFCSKWETYLLSRTPCCPYEREQRMPANLLLCSLLMRERLHEGDKRDLHDRVKCTKFQGELPVWMKCNKTWASSSIHERGMPNWEARSKPVINARASACMFLPEKKNSLTLVIPDNTTPCYESTYSGTVHIEFERANIRWMLTLRPLLGLGEIIGTWRAWRQAWSCKPSRVEKNHSVKQPLPNFLSRFNYIELYIVMNNGIAVFPNFP